MLLETYYNCSLDKYSVLSIRKWNETSAEGRFVAGFVPFVSIDSMKLMRKIILISTCLIADRLQYFFDLYIEVLVN